MGRSAERTAVWSPTRSGAIGRGAATPTDVTECGAATNPEGWQKLVSAYERTMKNPEFIAFLKQNDIGADWLGPDKTTEVVKRNYEILLRYKDKIEK